MEKGSKHPPGTLSKELPVFSERLLQRTDTSEMDRARAYFFIKQYADAEASALRAKDAALAATPFFIQHTIDALVLAGQSAAEQTNYKRALAHYSAAAALTSEERDVLTWADIQNEIGWLIYRDGQYEEQANLIHQVWLACKNAGRPEHPVTLRSHNLWALALFGQGKHAAAEAEHRAALPIYQRVHGPEHRKTLMCWMNLANALHGQRKYAKAKEEHSAVLAIRQRVLGPEHPDTLLSRMNRANVLHGQGEYADAEAEHRNVLAIRKRILGSEHPDTLMSQNNRANALHGQGEYADAEAEHRTVLAIRERVLGPEHPDTLKSQHHLANALHVQGKHADAEAAYRNVLAIRERMGPENPEVFLIYYNLSHTLEKLDRRVEALDYTRRALAAWGEDHPYFQDAKQRVERLEQGIAPKGPRVPSLQ